MQSPSLVGSAAFCGPLRGGGAWNQVQQQCNADDGTGWIASSLLFVVGAAPNGGEAGDAIVKRWT